MKYRGFLVLLFWTSAFSSNMQAQRIQISEPDKEDSRRMNFEIIGKMGDNFLIYKNVRTDNFICVYDNNMNQIGKVKHEYLPDERLINVDFFAYPGFVYMIYQYQRRNIVHCAAVKLDEMGKKISEPFELDTTSLGGSINNKIYTVLTSEDKQKLMIFKINSRNRDRFQITTKLLNDKLDLLKKSVLIMPMDERDDHLGEFAMFFQNFIVPVMRLFQKLIWLLKKPCRIRFHFSTLIWKKYTWMKSGLKWIIIISGTW